MLNNYITRTFSARTTGTKLLACKFCKLFLITKPPSPKVYPAKSPLFFLHSVQYWVNPHRCQHGTCTVKDEDDIYKE